jgi:urease accessory protein
MKRGKLLGTVALFLVVLVSSAPPALAHENQVIQFGSFLGGLLHPVLGLDHFLAMLSVGIISAFIGGRAIWIVPATFVTMMAVGGLAGANDLGITPGFVETAIAVSVLGLGSVIALDRSLKAQVAMGAVAFFGFFHGYAHGLEIPEIARPVVYAGGFLLGTALIHLLGVLVGDISRRYPAGRPVMRAIGGGFVVVGFLFIGGIL